MSFKENNYQVIRNVISKDVAHFVYKYFLLKRDVCKTFRLNNYISRFNNDWGQFGDGQVPKAYAHFGDIAMETLLTEVQPFVEKMSGVKLIPTYAYARIYNKGDVLKKHKDRFSCEISTTLNLGGDPWPIFIEPDPKQGTRDEKEHYIASKSKGIKVELNPGDMLMYRGCVLEHWREIFLGKDCGQVFLHYNDAENNFKYDKLTNPEQFDSDKNKYDGRPHLGLPAWFRLDKLDRNNK